jgi:hypothetical protein
VLLFGACTALPLAIAVGLIGIGSPMPKSFDVTGVMGNIGEWEVTAALARNGETREFSGPMKVTHIGSCSQDGPLEKTGELQIKLARLSSSISAKVRLDGVECDYAGSLSDAYTGMIACPGRRPVQLLLWIR